jgi:hypothetical protein
MNGPKEAKDVLVFFVRRDTECAECGEKLPRGSMITVEKGRGALCLSCADLDHLDYLSRGDAVLTRRSRKHSRLSAVVVQWSRTRKRYERQGILAEPEAIERAEAECLGDAEQRLRRREREGIKREAVDRQYVADFEREIRRLYPCCPAAAAAKIAAHACRKHSGRVGRSAAAKRLEPGPIDLAVTAWVRHNETNYDDLLAGLHDRHWARETVRGDVERVRSEWAGQS